MSKQKINKLLIGTNNKGKLREIKSLLPKSIKIYSTSVFNVRSPVENGKTFKENSLIKSKYFSNKQEDKKNLNIISESDKIKINKLINKMSVKNIVETFSKKAKVSKSTIYNYCLRIKNEK